MAGVYDGKIRKTFVRFSYLLRHRESGKYLGYPQGYKEGDKFRLMGHPLGWGMHCESGHSGARDFLADLPEREFPGRTKREDYEIVRLMDEHFERQTILPPREKVTKKKGRKK